MAETKTRPSQERPASEKNGHAKQYTLGLPMMTIQFRPPDVRLPHVSPPAMPHVTMPHVSRQELGQAVDIARSFMPPPERLAYYGALGALAVFGVLEWPVAAAIGAGAIIAQRSRSEGPRPPIRKPATTPDTASRTSAGQPAAAGGRAAATTGRAAATTGRAAASKAATGRTAAGRTTEGKTATSRSRASTAASKARASASGAAATASKTPASRRRTSTTG
ncbi:hypothetical protein [Nonomuraea sp. NPDC048916]|uniref:hypothetical protein n=1 Tax=Nonomuraea sp. NPDC048916 TaxID=3154232 RepID=UPI0033E3DB42